VFNGVRAEQPVTHIRYTNSKPQQSNQFITNKIELHPTSVLVREAISVYINGNLKKWQTTVSQWIMRKTDSIAYWIK